MRERKKQTLKNKTQKEQQMIIQCQKNTLHDLTRNHRNSRMGGKGRNYGRVVVEGSRTKFDCKTITNPEELARLGYGTLPNRIPANDYEILKQVA